MEISKIWDSHVTYTKEFSTTTRQLAFASIAVCWVLKPTIKEIVNVDPLMWSLVFSSLYFICDCLQYALGAIVHFYLAKKCEKQQGTSIDKNPKYDWPSYFFLILKSIFLIASYAFIIYYLCSTNT